MGILTPGWILDDIVWTPYDTYAWLRGYFWDQPIPVSVHAWMDGLHRESPSTDIKDYLTISSSTSARFGEWQRIFAGDVSDTLVFDFLIDGMLA